MKKIAVLFTLLIALTASNAEASIATSHSYADTGTGTTNFGQYFVYNYSLNTQTGSSVEIKNQADSWSKNLLNMFLNTSGFGELSVVWSQFDNTTFGNYTYKFNAVAAVPLPAALPMFGAALAGLGFYRRRKAAKIANIPRSRQNPKSFR